MKKIITSVFIITATLGTVSLKAQTAEDIVAKNIEAVGGADKIKQVNSIYMTGSSQVMGNESPTAVTILNGKGYKTESEFNGAKIIQCVNDKGGWMINPMAGGSDAQPMPDDVYKAAKEQLNIGGALLDYATKGSTIQLLGKDGNAYKIKLTTKDKDETTFYIDAATYYISKVVKKGNMMGQEIEITTSLSDYKKTDIGYVLPYTMSIDYGQFQVGITFKKVEINKTIDPAVFMMPK